MNRLENTYNYTSTAPAYHRQLPLELDDIIAKEKEQWSAENKRRELQAGISQLRRAAKRERMKMMTKCFVSLLVVATLLAIVLHRQTNIVQLNVENNRRLSNLKEMREEADQVTKKLLASVDLDNVAELAAKKYEMQVPSPERIIFLQLNEADKIVYYNEASEQTDNEKLNAEDIKTIENYRKALQKNGKK